MEEEHLPDRRPRPWCGLYRLNPRSEVVLIPCVACGLRWRGICALHRKCVGLRGLFCRWRKIRACNDNAWGASKSQNSHDNLLALTFLIAATDPKAPMY